MKASMQDEYAVRLALENMLYLVLPLTYIFISYLESLGVIPNRKNVQMIKKEIPLRHIKLTAAFKSRGGLEDMFYVQNVEVRFASQSTVQKAHKNSWRGWAAEAGGAAFVATICGSFPLRRDG